MRQKIGIFALAFLGLGAAAPAQAAVDVAIRLGVPAERPVASPWYRRAYLRPRPVIVAPVLVRPVRRPVYAVPVVVASPLDPRVSGRYADDLAALNSRLAQQRALVNRQLERGGLSRGQYDLHMNALESIERDERAWAYERGALSGEDLSALWARLDRVAVDIDSDLSE